MKKLIMFFALLISASVSAQDRQPHEVYSMMIFNFSKYIQWPDHATSGEFVIGVMGNNEVYNTLSTWYGGKPRGSKTYVIKKFNSAAELAKCDILFIANTKSYEFDNVLGKIQGKGTLLITDKNGLGGRGSVINFKKTDDKLKFELDQRAAESANLKVSSSLTAMAILI
jgi:hypothetical protein